MQCCAQPRGKAGSPHRSDGRLSPSSQETLEAVLVRLATSRRTLEVWTEQLRSWLAAELLQPLDRLAATVQKVRSPTGGHGQQIIAFRVCGA